MKLSRFIMPFLWAVVVHADIVVDSDVPYAAQPTSAATVALMIFSFLGLSLLVPPLIVQYQIRNIGQCFMIICVFLANFFTFINAIIWPNFSYADWWDGAVLCDIEAKLYWAIFTGVTCATVCTTRRLALAIDPNNLTINTTRSDRTRAAIEDFLICLTIPVIQICLHYVIQYNRYYVAAVIGCIASYDNSWPTIVINYIWPPLFSLLNCYYAILIIVRLHRHRTKVSQLLGGSSRNLSMFLRMTMNSFLLVLVYTPVAFYLLYINLDIQWYSYSWDLIHNPQTMSTIVFIPVIQSRISTKWTSVVMAFFIFYFYGLGQHAIETYRKFATKLGLGRYLPSLYQRRGSEDGSSSSWSSRFGLVSRVRSYFERERKSSTGTFETMDTNVDTLQSRSRKSSLLPSYNHISPTKPVFSTPTKQPLMSTNDSTKSTRSCSEDLDDNSICPLSSPTVSNPYHPGVIQHTLPPMTRGRAPRGTFPSSYGMPTFENLSAPLSKWFSDKKQSGRNPISPASKRGQPSNHISSSSEMQNLDFDASGGAESSIRTTIWSDPGESSKIQNERSVEDDAGTSGMKVFKTIQIESHLEDRP